MTEQPTMGNGRQQLKRHASFVFSRSIKNYLLVLCLGVVLLQAHLIRGFLHPFLAEGQLGADRMLRSRQLSERHIPEQPEIDEYECRGFRTTVAFSPFSFPRLFRFLKSSMGYLHSCDETVPETDDTGYCEFVHKTTGEVLKVFHQTPPPKKYNTKQGAPWFKCSMAHEFHH